MGASDGNRGFDSQRLAGKVALVTGAASGIGRATAVRLAAEGARVAAADVNEAEPVLPKESNRGSGRRVLALRLDVTSVADWQAAMQRIRSEWGRLDVCVNSAGIAFAQPIAELDLVDWHRVLAVNLDGVFLGTKYAARTMKECGGGSIINLASVAGIEPYAGNAAYGTSKAAIRFFTRIAALEGEPHQIRVNSISPGAVATSMWKATPLWPREIEESDGLEAALQFLIREHGFVTPEQVAATVAFLAGADSSHLSGRDFTADGRTDSKV